MDDKKKIVWISPFLPYDKVNHAGGKNHNYFLKYIHKKDCFDIKLLTICNEDEQGKSDLDSYGIVNQIEVNPQKGIKSILKKVYNIESTFNIIKPSAGLLSNSRYRLFRNLIRDNKREIERADILIFQWTEALLVYPYVKKICELKAKVVAIEEDVAFLGFRRKYETSTRKICKIINKIKYNRLKKTELDLLEKCEVVCCVTEKDRQLLIQNSMNEKDIIVTPSFFDRYYHVDGSNSGQNIIFWGNMSRKENWLSAKWFIDEVMPLLPEGFRFYVVGANPVAALKKCESSRVIVTGFVEDVSAYLEDCLCTVAPLVLGAGLKIKVLECMSAGKVVLTNSIGIEGINAINQQDYIHCELAQEYADAILQLSKDAEWANKIGENARSYIENWFNTDKALDNLVHILEE